MFLWLKVKGVDDTKDLIEKKAVKKEVRWNWSQFTIYYIVTTSNNDNTHFTIDTYTIK